ncbi:MAG: hypothetical protein K2X60_07030 [Xanthobacteraceae bacterium]|nr:hypothetical protein [Xanthobacteraceae bacterium]
MPTIGFPLLLIPLAIYNIVVFLMPGVAFTAPLATVRLISGTEWPVTLGDALLAVSLLLLLFEVIKATRPGAKYLTDHLLSLLAFGGALAEFVLLSPFGTSTFFLLTALTAVDFLAGAASALRHRRYRAVDEIPADHHDMPRGDALERPIADEPAGSWGPEPLQREAARPEPPRPVSPVVPPPAAPQASAPAVVPPVEQIVPAVHEAARDEAKPARKISDWSVADLVHDADPGDTRPPSGKPPSAS